MSDTGQDKAGATSIWSLDKASTRRSLFLCALGALTGLVVAGFGLFTAQGTRTANVPAEDAAIVNNVPILMADFIEQIRALHGVSLNQASPAQKEEVLDDMIREELYVQRGVEIGLTNDDTDVRSALVSATEAQFAADIMSSKPTQDELRAWYREHPDQYASEGTIELEEFVIPKKSAADSARYVDQLRKGVEPSSLDLRSSGRVDDGEEFYFAAKLHLGPRIFAVARAMKAGEVSDPIDQPDGMHILRMKSNNPPTPSAFEQVEDQVQSDFLRDKIARLQAGNDRFLRKRADIRIAKGLP